MDNRVWRASSCAACLQAVGKVNRLLLGPLALSRQRGNGSCVHQAGTKTGELRPLRQLLCGYPKCGHRQEQSGGYTLPQRTGLDYLADAGLAFLIERARLAKLAPYTEFSATLEHRAGLPSFDFGCTDEGPTTGRLLYLILERNRR